MKPICVNCNRFYRPEKNGIIFTEGMPTVQGAEPGQPSGWEPYKVWRGDLWRCQGCGNEVISGVAREPMGEHYQEGFGETAKLSEFTVYDC